MFAWWKAIWGEEGASMVEAAFVGALIFTPAFIGIIEGGSLVYASIEIADAAHDGAAYAAQYYNSPLHTGTLPSSTSVQTVATAAAPDLNNGLLSNTTPVVTMVCGCPQSPTVEGAVPTAGQCLSPYPTSATCTVPYYPIVQVTFQTTVTPIISFAGFGGMTMSSTASLPLVKQ